MSNYSRQQIFTEVRTSLKLSLPLIAAELVYGLSGFTSTAMVAHLGREELAANALVWGVFITLILLFIGILSATGILVAQSFGAKDSQGIQIATKQGLILAVILAFPMMLAVFLAPNILIFTGQDPTIIKIATPYFHALMWTMLPLNILVVLEQFLLGIAQTRLVLLMSLLTVPIQLTFFYAFMFGRLGLPKIGLAGIGYGMASSHFLGAIVVGIYIKYAKVSRDYQIFNKCWQYSRKFLCEILRVGLPMGAMHAVEVALFTTLAFMIGHFGRDVLAAHQIAFQCYSFSLTLIFALSQATSIRVGHEVGRNDKAAIKLAAYGNIGIGFCWMLFLGVLYIGIPKHIISLDVNIHNPQYKELIYYAVRFLFIATILQFTDCFRILSVAALRGLKDTKALMFISIIGFWFIAFSCAYTLGFVFHYDAIGIWWGLEIGLAICALILLLRFRILLKKLDLEKLLTRAEK